MSIWDTIKEKASEKGIGEVTKKFELCKLKNQIKEQFELEKKKIDNSAEAAEIDFDAVKKCVLRLCDKDILEGLSAFGQSEYDDVKNKICIECVQESAAKSRDASEKVKKLFVNSLAIVESFLGSGISKEDKILARNIVEDVKSAVKEESGKMQGQLKNIEDDIKDIKETVTQSNAPVQAAAPLYTDEARSYLDNYSFPLFLENEEDGTVLTLADMYISPSIKGKEENVSDVITKWYKNQIMKPCMLLYGNAGIGKSSLVTKLLADAYGRTEADKTEFELNSGEIIVAALRDHTEGIDYNTEAKEILKQIFSCENIDALKSKLIILDGLDELCVLMREFDGAGFVKTFSELEAGFHVLVTSRGPDSYFNAPQDAEGLRTEELVWEESQIKDWIEKYRSKKAEKEDWSNKFLGQFNALEAIDPRRMIFCVPIILYICGSSEIDLENHSSIGSIYNDAFRSILLRKHMRGKSSMSALVKEDKEDIKAAWQFTKEIAYQMSLLDTLDLVDDDRSDDTKAVGFRNAKKRTADILGIEQIKLDISKELALCPFTRRNGSGGITFAHKTVYEYFTAVKLYEDYFAQFDKKFFSKSQDETAETVMNTVIEAFRYGAISEDVFKYLCEMDGVPFISKICDLGGGGIDHEGFKQAYIYAMKHNYYAKISAGKALDEYLYPNYIKDSDGIIQYADWMGKSVSAQISTSFANLTWFLTGIGFTNAGIGDDEEPVCAYIGNYLHGSLNKACFEKWNLKDIRWEGAYLKAAHMEGADLTHAYLNKVCLKNAHLTDVILENACLDNSDMEKVKLKIADLTDALIRNANLSFAELVGANMTGAKLDYSDLSGIHSTSANYNYTSMSHANLQEAVMTFSSFEETNLSFAILVDANMAYAHFEYADLICADLTHASFIAAHFNNADLRMAILYFSFLRDADLENANLTGADLELADLSDAHLEGANLTRANLRGCTLIGADLSDAILEDAVFSEATYCNDPEKKTIFPDSFDPKAHGMIEVDKNGNPVE